MKFYISLILFLITFGALAQVAVTGTVSDAESGQTLPHCDVTMLGLKNGTTTDENGKFKVDLPAGSRIVFSYIGYKSDTIEVNPSKTEYTILLIPIRAVLDEIVVSAIARTGLIKDNPVSISNVTLKMIERSNESNIIDALSKNTPGLNTLKTGPNISKPFIRGMGFNRVLTLYDGVRQEGQQWGGEHGLEIDNYNIERAEIIKGPASLVYGSDALAGAISLIPFIPKESDGIIRSRWLSEYQSNNGLWGNGYRVSQGNKHWLWAIRSSYRIAKNYTNRVDGPVYNTAFQEKNVSGLLGYKSAKGFTHFNVSLYDNLQGIPDGSRDSLTRRFTKQIYEGDNDDIKSRPVVSDSELNTYTLSPLHQRIQHYRAYINNHYEIGKGDIQALFAFVQNIRREFIHPTAPAQAGTYHRLNTFNYSLRYNAPEISGIETSVGLNGMYQKNTEDQGASNFAIPNYNLFDFGVYALATWKKERWNMIGGLRFDSRSVSTSTMYTATDAITSFDKQVSPPDTVGSTLQFQAMNQTFRGITLSLGTTYRISEHFNFKFNFSRGYRAPSISEIASNGLDAGAHIIYIGNPNFVPEFSWQEDLGLLATFPGVSASLSLFNKDIENYIYLNQVTDGQGNPLTDAQGNKTIQYQQSTAQMYGLEATFAWRPKGIPGLAFNNQFSMCYGFNRGKEYENKKDQGEYLPFIPPARWVSSLNKEFRIKSKLISGFNMLTELDFNAAQNRFLALFDTETKTQGYALLNAGLGVTLARNYQFQFQVNNLLDEVYQSNMSRLKYFEYYTQSPNGRSGIYGMGRNVCAKIIFSF